MEIVKQIVQTKIMPELLECFTYIANNGVEHHFQCCQFK